MGAFRGLVERLWGRSEGEDRGQEEQELALDFLAHVRPFDATRSRGHQRYPCRLPLTVVHGLEQITGVALDVSASGLGARVASPLPRDARVEVRFGAAGSHVRAAAIVVWSRREGAAAGVGLRFDLEENGSTEQIQALVRRVAASVQELKDF